MTLTGALTTTGRMLGGLSIHSCRVMWAGFITPKKGVVSREFRKMSAFLAFCTHYVRQGLKFLFPASRHSLLVERTPYRVPVPRERHKEITEDEIDGRKLLVIGDVHGCCDELEELLDKCDARDPSRVCILFVGDLVNKGPKSAEVIRLVRELRAFSVRGNHDEVSMLTWQKDADGEMPLPPKFQWMRKLTKQELEWFFELPFTLRIPSRKIIVTHAGLVQGVELRSQSMDNMLHMKHVHFDLNTLSYAGFKQPRPGSQHWAEVWEGPEHVYFGHDAKGFFQSHPYATGLDTGCVYGNYLTAVFPEEGNRRVQVKAAKNYKGLKEGQTMIVPK